MFDATHAIASFDGGIQSLARDAGSAHATGEHRLADGYGPNQIQHPHAGAALALENVTLSFGGVVALTDVNLAVRKGEIRAIIGPNGAGKSSLVNVISGVYRPDHGRIWIGEKSYPQVPTARLASLGIARTFQNLALFKGLSVRDNITAGLAFRHRSSAFSDVLGLPWARAEERIVNEAAETVMEFLHLTNVSGDLAGGLPYGLQKRVELARALIAHPDILLLDEPMAGMTATEKQDMAHFVRATRLTYGSTIILIEHDIGVVMELSDRIAVLDYGRKIADDTPDNIQNDEAVIDAYLGVARDNEQGGGI